MKWLKIWLLHNDVLVLVIDLRYKSASVLVLGRCESMTPVWGSKLLLSLVMIIHIGVVYLSSLMFLYAGQLKIKFIPELVGPFLEMTLIPETGTCPKYHHSTAAYSVSSPLVPPPPPLCPPNRNPLIAVFSLAWVSTSCIAPLYSRLLRNVLSIFRHHLPHSIYLAATFF